MTRGDQPRGRRGFTLVEMMVAAMITAFVVGAVSVSLSQLGRAKSSSRTLLSAHLRADSALTAMRRDIASVLRDPDLFWTRLLLEDHTASTPLGPMDRDEILLFSSRMRPVRDLDFIGDGIEFETQYRIDEDDLGPVLWQRRDAVPDEYPRGGGVATPLIAGIVGLALEAYDGDLWYPSWDSDFDGLPLAIRVTVVASGSRDGADPFESPLAILRTVIPIDRVAPPQEPPAQDDEEEGEGEGDQPDGIDGSLDGDPTVAPPDPAGLPGIRGEPGQPGGGFGDGGGGSGGGGGADISDRGGTS